MALWSEVAMESTCKEMACAEPQRDVNTVTKQNECTVTWSVKLEAFSEDEVVSGGFTDHVCCKCGGRFAFLNCPTQYFVKHEDGVCCHMCQMKFSHMSLLGFHLKNAHTSYSMLCKRCNSFMGHVPTEWSVETDKLSVTLKNELLDEDVDEVIVKNEEVETKYVKQEEEEVVVGSMEEPKENSITKTPVDIKMDDSYLFDHSYFSTQTCNSLRKTSNNVIMYTSSENVLVFINKTDSNITPKDSFSEGDQQGTPVNDQRMCGVVHDHTYIANPVHAEQESVDNKTAQTVMHCTETIPVFNNDADTKMHCKDQESTESNLDHIWKHDHTYFARQKCSSSEFDPIQGDALREYEETIQRSNDEDCDDEDKDDEDPDYEDSDNEDSNLLHTPQDDHSDSDTVSCTSLDLVNTLRDDLLSHRKNSDSDTVSCASSDIVNTDSNDKTSKEGCVYQKQNCTNTNQESLSHADSVTSNPAASLYKDLEICIFCGLSKVSNTKKSTGQCSCTLFTCSLCGIVFATGDMLLNHQAEEHTLAKYACARCLQLFPNQNIFMKHICSTAIGFSGQSLSLSETSNNGLFKILNFGSSAVGAESSKQQINSQKDNIITVPNVIQVMTSSSSGCAQQKKATCLVLNGDQGQVTTPISTVTQKQIGHIQVLSPVQTNMVTQIPSSSSNQIHFLSSQCQSQITPISTFPQINSRQMQVLSPVQTNTVSQTSSSSSTQIHLLSSQCQSQITPISTVPQINSMQMQVLSPVQTNMVSQTSSSSSTQIHILSSQCQSQITPISTVPHINSRQMQVLTPLQSMVMTPTPTGSAALASGSVLPQQHPSIGVHLPPPVLSSSMSVPSQTGQPFEPSVPFLDFCRSALSTKVLPSSKEPLRIVGMFVNQSKDLALQKRMLQSWRSKAVIPCRQCGAMSRQFSLAVRHRYQHRGPRIHRCQCGRAFQHRMHLLRHQVQHAEATRYVCAACGQMFCGMQQLARHKPVFRFTPSNRKKLAKKKCRNVFQCYCGHSFTRPAALLWHMLKNTKSRSPRTKAFRLT